MRSLRRRCNWLGSSQFEVVEVQHKGEAAAEADGETPQSDLDTIALQLGAFASLTVSSTTPAGVPHATEEAEWVEAGARALAQGGETSEDPIVDTYAQILHGGGSSSSGADRTS